MAVFLYIVLIVSLSLSAVRSVMGLVQDVKDVKRKREMRERVFAFLEKEVVYETKETAA